MPHSPPPSPIRPRIAALLDRATALNPALNALIAIRSAAALAEADRLDAAARRGEAAGPLAGLAIAVKDNIDIAGEPTTAGAAFRRDAVAERDAPVIERLRQAGAVLIAKANLMELAFGATSFSTVGGQCRNPWDPRRIPGGSSGGSAVAVAVGLCDAALGTDTGASLRVPAAWTGVCALRPTHGRVPIRGVVPVSAQHDTVGPIARTVADVARVFAVIAGPDPDDPWSAERPLDDPRPSLSGGVRGLRIGLPRRHYFDRLGPGIGDAVLAGARTLEAAGATLVDVDVPGAEDAQAQLSRILFSDACQVFRDRIDDRPPSICTPVLERLRLGRAVTGVDYAEAIAFRQRFRHGLRRLFGRIDLLLSPTVTDAPPRTDDGRPLVDATREATRNCFAGALGALPGLTLPCGLTPDGLPIGLQLEAGWWQEAALLRAGAAFQAVTDFHRLAPADPPAAPGGTPPPPATAAGRAG